MGNRLVIFDLDGTLFRTDLIIEQAARRAAIDVGLPPPDPQAVVALVGERADVFARRLMPDLDDANRKRFLQELGHYERRLIPEAGRLFDGVEGLLKELRDAGYTLAICSNAGLPYIKLVLSTCGVFESFRHLQGREPSGSKANSVRRLLDEVNPDWAVLVGDRRHDIEAARVNDLPCVGAGYGYAPDEAGQADLVAEKPSDVPEKVLLCDIFSRVEQGAALFRADRPFVVGVNGVDTSGKTVFAKSLSEYLINRRRKVQLIHLDDFHNPSRVRSQGKTEVEAYIQNAFNLDLLIAELLEPARQGSSLNTELTLLDLAGDTFTNRKHYRIVPETIVLLEGVLLYREPLDQYFDFRIFLDITFEEVLRRAERRDVPGCGPEFLGRYHRKYIPIQKWYLDTHSPVERSDLVVDNNDCHRPRVAAD